MQPRDRSVICKAMAYAVALIDSLPEDRREWSDRQDMADVLERLMPDERSRAWLAQQVENHAGIACDLMNWKRGE